MKTEIVHTFIVDFDTYYGNELTIVYLCTNGKYYRKRTRKFAGDLKEVSKEEFDNRKLNY